MRLTDDYLILSDEKAIVKTIIDKLDFCASQNNFEFNQDKLRSNFTMPRFEVDSNNREFKWIGKIINLETMELFHT